MTIYGFILGGLIISASSLPLVVHLHVGVRKRWSMWTILANCLLVYGFAVFFFDNYPPASMQVFLGYIIFLALPLAVLGRYALTETSIAPAQPIDQRPEPIIAYPVSGQAFEDLMAITDPTSPSRDTPMLDALMAEPPRIPRQSA